MSVSNLSSKLTSEITDQYLQRALFFLEGAFVNRLIDYFGLQMALRDVSVPLAEDDNSDLAMLVQELSLDEQSLLVLLLAFVPYIKPDLIDNIVHDTIPASGDYPQLGGLRGKQHRGFLPTGDTVLFLLAGDDLEKRLFWQDQLRAEHTLVKKGILYLDTPLVNEPPMSGRLYLDEEYAEKFISGKVHPPAMSTRFPAQLLTTRHTWNDLILPSHTMTQVHELQNWVKYERVLMHNWDMQKKLRPGMRALFYGPPGTGKTLTATLIGDATNQPVYRVDLSMVVSKYIGETEKNLANLFDKAENKNWILFFDEADSLFGKRTQVKDSHDRYANQEVSFLLQRIEGFNGLIVLASNLANNVDEAFSRRFEQVIHFLLPKKNERLLIWKNAFPENIVFEAGLELSDIANRFEISGGMIMNVVRHVCMQAIIRNEDVLRKADFIEGVRREYAKENRLE